METNRQHTNRDLTLDVMKSLLVIGMIQAHVIQLCLGTASWIASAFSLFINIITFSSFLFCFGCASQFAYFGRYESASQARKKLLRNFARLLICFYISGYGYVFLMTDDTDIVELLKVLLLWRIPGYSEFLLSFAMLNLVILVFFNVFRSISVNKYKTMGG